jgi:hypothetical protein
MSERELCACLSVCVVTKNNNNDNKDNDNDNDGQVEHDNQDEKWSSLRRQPASILEGGGKGAVVAAMLHALLSVAHIPLQMYAAPGGGGGWRKEVGWWDPLKVAECALRGGEANVLLMCC